MALRPHHLALAVVLAVAQPVATAHTGSLAFWQEVSLSSAGPASAVFWISIPYRYTPADSNSNSMVDLEDMVQDLQPADLPHPCTEAAGDCAVARVWRWDETAGEYVSWTGGGAGAPFEVSPGTGYGIELQGVLGDSEHLIDLVGAHDPSFELSDCHSPGDVNMRWISLPPHIAVDTSFGVPDALDAEDLGQAMGGPDKVFQIRRWNEATGLYDSWVVGSVYSTPFEIDLTRAYGIDLSCEDLSAPCAQCQWTWTPDHF